MRNPPFLSDALSAILPTSDQTMLLRACLWTGEAGRKAWMKWHDSALHPKEALKKAEWVKELLPLLYHSLEQNHVDLDQSFRTCLRMAYVYEELRSQTYRQIFKETVSILTASGISFLVLGGAPLIKGVYNDWALRHCHDINLILKKEDLKRAIDVLSAQENFVSGGKHVSGFPICLASFLFNNLSITEVLKNAEEVEIDGVTMKTLCVTDYLLFILGRTFSSPSRNSLRWVCDVYFLLLKRSMQIDWDFLFHRTAESRLILPFWVMFNYFTKELKAQIPSFFLNQLAKAKTTSQDYKTTLLAASESSRGFKNLFKHSKSLRERIFLSKTLLQKMMS